MTSETDPAFPATNDSSDAAADERKPYNPPAIVHELKLETRAGSPIGLANPLNPFDPRPRI